MVFYKDTVFVYHAVTAQKAVVPLNCLQGKATLESLLAELMPDLALRKRTHTDTHKQRKKMKEKGWERELKSKP